MIIILTLALFISFLVALAFAWDAAYSDHPTLDKFGRKKKEQV